MSGHGHVIPNDDGSKARCGGPAICNQCSREAAALWRAQWQCETPQQELERARHHHATLRAAALRVLEAHGTGQGLDAALLALGAVLREGEAHG